MDIRNILNRYFDKTPIPDELDPRNVSKFVVPNLAEKRRLRQRKAMSPTLTAQRIITP